MQAKQKSNSIKSDKKQKTRNQGQRPGQQRPSKQGGRGPVVQRAPVAIGNKTFQSKPRYKSMGDSLIVSHSEYIGDITGSTSTFVVAKTINVNPGISGSFPWLNQIASRYESYKFRKLHFRFMTERPTTESGYVAIVPDFDPTDAAPVDKQTAFQYQAAAKAAPWENLTQVCPSQDLVKRKSYFVRQGALASNETLGLYDTGNIFICVGGNSGVVNLGELWCDYDVELMTPQLDSNYGASSSGFANGGGAFTGAAIFGTTPVSTFSRDTLWTLVPATGTLTFNQNYQGLMSLVLTGTVISAVSDNTGTSTVSNVTTVINSAATVSVTTLDVNALAGQTLILSATATTVTGSAMRMGAYLSSLG